MPKDKFVTTDEDFDSLIIIKKEDREDLDEELDEEDLEEEED